MTILHITCKECGESKPWTEFYRKGKTGGVRKEACKSCANILEVARKQKRMAEDPEYAAKRREQYRNFTNTKYATNEEYRAHRIKVETERYSKCAKTREAAFVKAITRRATKKQRTVTDDGLTMVVLREAHALTKLREKIVGGKWDVDHIEPLLGQMVSGLHVASNFAVVPRTLNRGLQNRPKEVGCFGCVLSPR